MFEGGTALQTVDLSIMKYMLNFCITVTISFLLCSSSPRYKYNCIYWGKSQIWVAEKHVGDMSLYSVGCLCGFIFNYNMPLLLNLRIE